MNDCIFCKIINKEIKSDIVYENSEVVIFKDVNPKAPVHLLAVPTKHIDSLTEIDLLSDVEICSLMKAIAKIAADLKLKDDGFRVVTNIGVSAGQSVNHLHFHILGKRNFEWPPG